MRSIIKREHVRADEGAASPRPPREPQGSAHSSSPGSSPGTDTGARARLIRLDEQTQAIEFTCPCGEVSLIEIQTETKP